MILRDYTAADLDGMDSKSARAAFQQHVDEYNRQNEPDPVKCFTAVRDSMPRLYAAAFPSANAVAETKDQPTPIPNSSNPPGGMALYLPLMHLPPTTTKLEFSIAWMANGSKATPLNEKAMFDALVGYYQSSQKLPPAAAEKAVAEKFPSLAPAGQK